MAEDITDVSEGTAVETDSSVTDSAPETAEPVTPEPTPEAENADSVDWDTPFPEFPVEEEVTEEAPVSTADEKKEGEESPTPESGEEANAEEEDEDIDKINVAEIDPSKPPRLSRRQKEKLVSDIIEPFRDPSVPPEDVFKSLYALNPDRATTLASTIAEVSAKTNPNEWLSHILGEEVTVEDVKAKLSSTPTQANGANDSFSVVEDALNETYGDRWKDPSQDDQLLREDAELAKALRAYRSGEDAKATEIQQLKEQLESLKPEIQSVKDAQTQELEREKETLYESAVTEYRADLEKRSLEKLFTDAGLNPSESDTPDVKALKEYITGRFDLKVSEDFDRFFGSQFTDRDKGATIIQRVDTHLKNAAAAEAAAKRAKGSEAEQLRIKANSYREQAKAEQATLTVLHRKASQEFLDKVLSPVMAVLKQNSDLQRRVSKTRPELIGSAAPTGDDWKERLKEAEDPWASDEGWDAMAASR